MNDSILRAVFSRDLCGDSLHAEKTRGETVNRLRDWLIRVLFGETEKEHFARCPKDKHFTNHGGQTFANVKPLTAELEAHVRKYGYGCSPRIVLNALDAERARLDWIFLNGRGFAAMPAWGGPGRDYREVIDAEIAKDKA